MTPCAFFPRLRADNMADIGIINFQLGGIHFGIYADQILEIVQFTRARTIPRPLPYIVGLTEHRKYIVTVVDFRKRLGLAPFPLDAGTTMIILKASAGMLGLLVETLSHFKRIPEQRILPPLSIAGFPEYLLRGVFTEGENIILLPDLNKIFSSYIRIALLPISPAEKIAFQYRFTPGSLTRTLENTLKLQGYLDHSLVSKLPRSMCLPSVGVHKVTSYYPDFLPQKATATQGARQPFSLQKVKAGDETYLSLSRKLLSKQRMRENVSPTEEQSVQAVLQTAVALKPREQQVEMLLNNPHVGELLHVKYENVADEIIRSPQSGRQIAKALHVKTTRLTSYLSYYGTRKTASQQATQKETGVLPTSASTTSAAARIRRLCHTYSRVEDVLHVLHEEQAHLFLDQLRSLAAFYQIALVKIAKFCSLFPGITIERSVQEAVAADDIDEEPRKDIAQTRTDRDRLKPQRTAAKISSASVCRHMQTLAEQDLLTDDQAVRRSARQLKRSPCILSKFRSYYRLRNEPLVVDTGVVNHQVTFSGFHDEIDR